MTKGGSARHRLEVPATLDQIEALSAQAAAIAGVEGDWRDEVELALTEALTNVVRHSYAGDGAGHIEIDVLRADGQWCCTIVDHGAGMDPAEFERRARTVFTPPDSGDLDALAAGGRGIALMAQLLDAVSYERAADRNVLKLQRRLPATN